MTVDHPVGHGTRATTWFALCASAGTLVCCALPALVVTLGAGAALATLVSAVPQLVWISEHKIELFAVAGIALAIAGWLQWRTWKLPCPADPALARACTSTRRASRAVYAMSLTMFAAGGWFAFVAPLLSA